MLVNIDPETIPTCMRLGIPLSMRAPPTAPVWLNNMDSTQHNMNDETKILISIDCVELNHQQKHHVGNFANTEHAAEKGIS